MNKYLNYFLIFIGIGLFGCLSSTRLVEPGTINPKDACLALFGIVELTGPVSIGSRKDFDYRTYESGYLLLQEVKETKPDEISIKSKILNESKIVTGEIYKPKFSAIYEDGNWIRHVVDKTVDSKRIYYAFTGLNPGSSYALKEIGYTRTESYQVGNQTYTRSIPVHIRGDALKNYKNFPIVCNPNKADFLGIAGVSVYGSSFSVTGDVLDTIANKAEDSDLDYFFGAYENTRKGAAWYIRDVLFETQTSGYWHELLKPSEMNQKSIGK